MPAQTPQETQDKIVELRKSGKTYSQIQAALQVHPLTVAKVLKKAGLAGKSQPGPGKPPSAAPASSAAPAPASAKPAVSPPTSSADPLAEFQPPAPPSRPKLAPPPTYQCDACGARFNLDPGESIDSVKCPGCGGKP